MTYPPVPKEPMNIVAFDFDGVLAKDTWPAPWIGDPIEEGIKMLRHYRSLGNAIIVYTARPESHKQRIERWLADYIGSGVVYDVICGKPRACLYIDDRAWRFGQ